MAINIAHFYHAIVVTITSTPQVFFLCLYFSKVRKCSTVESGCAARQAAVLDGIKHEDAQQQRSMQDADEVCD
jgi:hypothetical protein